LNGSHIRGDTGGTSLVQRVQTLLASALTLTLAIAVAGCDGVGPSARDARTGTVKVGFITKFPGDFYDSMVDAAKKYDSEHDDVQVIFGQSKNGTDDEGQIAIIDNMIVQRVDAIAVTPTSPNVVGALDRAQRRGIKVVLVDNDLPAWTFKSSVVATDNVAGGRLAGQWLAGRLPAGSTVAVLQGRLGNPSLNDRVNGFKQGLGSAATIVAESATDCDQAKGLSVTQDLLARNPGVAAVYGACGPPIIGALQAITAAKRKPGSVTVIGFDASPDELAAIADGTQAASVAQFPDRMGRLGVETAVAAVRGEDIRTVIDTGTEIVTKQNVGQFR
jgi:ABC-type sugar transport system substrate-binding protein